MKISALLLFSLVCLTGATIKTPKATAVRLGKDFALFFAVNNYEHNTGADGWRNLSGPIKDAEDIAADLHHLYGFDTLVVRNPTLEVIRQTLNRYRRTYEVDDQMFIFFSGHGKFVEELGEGFFIPQDGRKPVEDPGQSTWLSLLRLRRQISSLPCHHILLAIDACYSGTFDDRIAISKNGGEDDDFERPNDPKGIYHQRIRDLLRARSRIYCSSGGKERTPDPSRFAAQWKTALRSLGGKDNILKLGELDEEYLQNAIPQPRMGKFEGQEDGGTFLFVYQSIEQLSSTNSHPLGDRDGDSVADDKDQCPDEWGNTPSGCLDYDEDGIPNKIDRCPCEKGLREQKGCPSADRDGDGVADNTDKCPDQVGIAQFQGCPDSDGDGVPDNQDKCPSEKGTAASGGCPGLATSVSDNLLRANKQFSLYAFNLALQTYKQVLKNDANNPDALAGIADCYFQLNNVDESLIWYKRAVENRTPNSDIQFRYGKALMNKGDYMEAKSQFLEYANLSTLARTAGLHYADVCDYALKTSTQQGIYAPKNEALNTEASDFGPAFFNDRLVYSSSRTDIKRKTSKSSSDWSGSNYNQLFVTQRDPSGSNLQKPSFLRSDLQNNYNEGPVSYSGDGKRVAFCRNNFINGTRQIAEKGMNMSLYIADVADGEWVNVKPFPYNGVDYATGFPSLTDDGNTLVFASNNPSSTTGGKGWDIYVSNFVNGEWSAPRNLGAPLNTLGNEITPYYNGTNLYFASDWHTGLGGFDVFRAQLANNDVTNIFHLGPGINSSCDDYGFIFNAQQNIGYLTSNRPGGRGNEDIWQVQKIRN